MASAAVEVANLLEKLERGELDPAEPLFVLRALDRRAAVLARDDREASAALRRIAELAKRLGSAGLAGDDRASAAALRRIEELAKRLGSRLWVPPSPREAPAARQTGPRRRDPGGDITGSISGVSVGDEVLRELGAYIEAELAEPRRACANFSGVTGWDLYQLDRGRPVSVPALGFMHSRWFFCGTGHTSPSLDYSHSGPGARRPGYQRWEVFAGHETR